MRFLLFVVSIINFFSFLQSNAQDIRISEICPSNAESYVDSYEETPDWFELHNPTNFPINLSEYAISTSNTLDMYTLPSIELEPQQYILFSQQVVKDAVKQWGTIIDKGDEWSYILPTQHIPDWNTLTFDDSNWDVGPSGFGYGDGDDETIIPQTMSVFIRKTFMVSDLENISEAILHMDYDDGFVAYINGVEVARAQMSGYPPDFDESAYGHEANWYQGNEIEAFEIEDVSDILVEGENVIAVQVHNYNLESSDLSAIPILSFGYTDVNQNRFVSSVITIPAVTGNAIFPFSLRAGGETFYLWKNNVVTDSIVYDDIPTDITMGRLINSSDFFYFDEPTPGYANGENVYAPKTLSKPVFSVPSGVYQSKMYVKLYISEPSGTIVYTTDGSEPTIQSNVFNINDSIKISRSSQIRARVFRNGYLPSAISTGTYIYHYRELNMPLISIVVKEEDFFDWETGMYVDGDDAEQEMPHYGANFWEDWEKPAHISIIEPGNTQASLSCDVGVKIAGNYSRIHPQKSLKFYARSRYGYNEMAYQFFKDKEIYSFQSFILRNSGNDFNNTQMRDGMISALVRNMSVGRSAYQPAIVYINGEYYGIQNFREKPNKHYFVDNYGVDEDSISLLRVNEYDTRLGTADNYIEMNDFLEASDLSESENYATIQEYLDVKDFIEYVLVEMYVVNEDWPGNNRIFWRENKPEGRWRHMLYDLDFGFGIWDDDKVTHNMLEFALESNGPNWPNPPWSTLIFRKLTENENFNHMLMNYCADRLNTTFSPDSVTHHIDSIFSIIESEYAAHAQRWNGSYEYMADNVQKMKDFGDMRADIMRQHFENHFNTNGSYSLSLSLSDNNAGKIRLTSIDITHFPWQGDYFNNVPMHITAVPAPGYEFVRWEGAVSSTETTISITTNQATSLHAVFEYLPDSEPEVFITEVMYHPADEMTSGQWIEFYNATSESVDISNWKLCGNMPYKSFTIPESTTIPAESYIVLCTNESAFALNYSASNVVGNIPFDFSNKTDVISLYNKGGYLIDKFAYADANPWPKKADGYGYSLSFDESTGDNSNSANWHGADYLGTPGAENSSIIPDPNRKNIVINEINYKSSDAYDSGDWVELFNSGTQPVDMSGWVISDNNDNNIAIIPEGSIINAGEYIVCANSPLDFAAQFPDVSYIYTPLSWGSLFDMVRIYDEYEHIVDSVSYSSLYPWPQLANGHGYTLSLRNPDLDNSHVSSWELSILSGTPGRENSGTDTRVEKHAEDNYVYPNPADELMWCAYEDIEQVKIYAHTGRMVYTGTTAKIDVSQLTTGVYVLYIQTKTEVYSHIVTVK
ncbi:MAG: lamin tail domain-containing protein [Bacteroidota bacterium]